MNSPFPSQIIILLIPDISKYYMIGNLHFVEATKFFQMIDVDLYALNDQSQDYLAS